MIARSEVAFAPQLVLRELPNRGPAAVLRQLKDGVDATKKLKKSRASSGLLSRYGAAAKALGSEAFAPGRLSSSWATLSGCCERWCAGDA